jgi:hypothetical protein
LRHRGSALTNPAANAVGTADSKNTSPAAREKTRSRRPTGSGAARARASRWLAWLAHRTNGGSAGRWCRPWTARACQSLK